jgi:tRNA(Arg) A34 adenosine deaminase TadA
MDFHEKCIRETMRLAQDAKAKGNHPFGALLTHDGEVILSAENTVNADHDVTRHAELNLVSQSVRRFSSEVLAAATLYTSTEPCAMCAGAIYWAGLRKVVYGCPSERLAELAGGSLAIPCREVFNRGREKTATLGPILEEEAVEVHRGFWKN